LKKREKSVFNRDSGKIFAEKAHQSGGDNDVNDEVGDAVLDEAALRVKGHAD
jgi:hypothetical protein